MFGIWGGGGAIHVLIKVFYMCSGTIMHNHVVTCNSILLVWHALIQFMVISAAVVAHELYPGFIHFLRKKIKDSVCHKFQLIRLEKAL